jgi:hypothetical protein
MASKILLRPTRASLLDRFTPSCNHQTTTTLVNLIRAGDFNLDQAIFIQRAGVMRDNANCSRSMSDQERPLTRGIARQSLRMSAMNEVHAGQSRSPLKQRVLLVFLAFAAMAIVLLWQDHRAHILGLIPWLFLLACPLMHVFMHHGHGSHSHHEPLRREDESHD